MELTRFGEGEPLLRWRLQELLSSSLRFHLSSIFAEAEGGADDAAAIKLRVLEQAAAHGIEVGPNPSEGFAAVVSSAMHSFRGSAPIAAEVLAALPPADTDDGAASRALTGLMGTAVLDLAPEEKEGLLRWARAHVILMQVFGEAQQLERLRSVADNAYHLTQLAGLAAHVQALGVADEAYFTPLCDMPAFQQHLYATASLARVARDRLVVFGLHGAPPHPQTNELYHGHGLLAAPLMPSLCARAAKRRSARANPADATIERMLVSTS